MTLLGRVVRHTIMLFNGRKESFWKATFGVYTQCCITKLYRINRLLTFVIEGRIRRR